jgi:hypothetical protein
MLSLLQCQCMFCPVSAYQQAASPGWCTGVSYWKGLDQMAAHSKSRLNLQIFFLQDPFICLVLYGSQSSMSTRRSNQQGLQFHIMIPVVSCLLLSLHLDCRLLSVKDCSSLLSYYWLGVGFLSAFEKVTHLIIRLCHNMCEKTLWKLRRDQDRILEYFADWNVSSS